MLRRLATLAAAAAVVLTAFSLPAEAATAGGNNDPSCVPSAAHPEPVVFLHGLGATYYEDINVLQERVAALGYCTFSSTYGAYPGFPYVGDRLQPADVRDRKSVV